MCPDSESGRSLDKGGLCPLQSIARVKMARFVARTFTFSAHTLEGRESSPRCYARFLTNGGCKLGRRHRRLHAEREVAQAARPRLNGLRLPVQSAQHLRPRGPVAPGAF